MEFEKTVNLTGFEKVATEQWYLSMRPASPKQTIKVKFNDGKSYKYLGTGKVNIDDPVIIDYGGATSYQMGNVKGIENGITIKRDNALKPLFVFTTNPGKAELKKNAEAIRYLERVGEVGDYFYGYDTYVNQDRFHVIDYLIAGVLNAISVIAFPALCKKETVLAAKDFLARDKSMPSIVFGKEFTDEYYGYYDTDFRLAESAEVSLTGYYPEWKTELERYSFLNPENLEKFGIEAGWDKRKTAYYLYFDDGNPELEAFYNNNEEFKQFTSELVMRSALSIIIRGGFANLLKAALSVEMPIKDFYSKLKEFAGEIESVECYKILKETDYENMIFEVVDTSSLPTYGKDMVVENNTLVEYTGKEEVVIIPESIKKIGEQAFFRNKYVKKVIIPDTVTQIKRQAFIGCEKLEDITFGKKVSVIGKYCFCECVNLKEVDLSCTKIKKLDECCFEDCILDKILLPDTLKSIEYRALGTVRNLKEMRISSMMERIDYRHSQLPNLSDVYFEGDKCEAFGIRDLPKGITFHCKKESEIWKNIENTAKLHADLHFKLEEI